MNDNRFKGAGESVPQEQIKKKTKFSDIFDTGYLRSIVLGAVSSVLLLVLVFYVCWHVAGGFEGEVSVSPALISTAREKESAVAYLFRDETVLTSEYAGAVDAVFSDGERVAAGELLLTAYKDPESAHVTDKLKEVDERIKVLQASEVKDNVSVSYTKALENSIETELLSLRERLASGNYSEALSYTDDLLVLLNRRALVFSSETDYSAALAALQIQRSELSASLAGEKKRVYAPFPGYYYSECDGGEDIFTLSALESLTPSALEELASRLPGEYNGKDGKAAVGKIVPSRKWYLAMQVPASSLPEYTVGENRSVLFTECGGYVLDMTLERSEKEGDKGLLVYSTELMPKEIEMVRSHNVELVKKEYTGLRVPVSAIRYLDGYTGVYARFGNTVLFRVIEVEGIVDGYAYVNENGKPAVTKVTGTNENGETTESEEVLYGALALYDNVITQGVGMYHGLIID